MTSSFFNNAIVNGSATIASAYGPGAVIPTNTVIGNVSGVPAAGVALNSTQLNSLLSVFVGDTGTGGSKGLVPAPASGDGAAGKFLKADGTFAVPPGIPATIASNTILGNNTGGAITPVALTGTQTTALLQAFVGDSGSGGVKGLVPAPAAGDAAAGKFLKADGTFATPLVSIASNTLLGNNTGGTANPFGLTGTQATALLQAVVGDSGSGGTKGLVPAPSAGDTAAGKFLKANGTFVDVKNEINLRTVSSIAELKALDTTTTQIVFDRSNGSGGTFEWRTGDFSASVTNDPGGGIYRKADAIAISAGCWVRRRTNLKVYPEWFGAVKDGTTNDCTAFQRAASLAAIYGWDVGLSSGKYGLAATVYIDYSTHTLNVNAENRTVNIIGEGSGNTQIVHSGFAGPAIAYTGKIISAGVSAKQLFSGFAITAAIAGSGTGMTMDNIAYATFLDVSVFSMNRALDFQDVLTSSFHGCLFLYGVYGIRVQYSDFSRPNAISFHGCSIAGYNENGLTVVGGTLITFYGGSLENIGGAGADPYRAAAVFTNPSVEGGVAFAAYGLHVEFNQGLADFLFNMSTTDPANIGFYSCNLQRGGSNKTTNNILVQQNTSTTGKVVLTCPSSFRHFAGYTPSGAEKAIRFISDAACEYEVHDSGAYYGSSLYRWGETSDTPFASVRFAGASGAITAHRAVDSVTRNSAGNYTINLRNTMNGSSPLVFAISSSSGSVYYAAATTTTVTVMAKDDAGTLIDPTSVHVVIYEGA